MSRKSQQSEMARLFSDFTMIRNGIKDHINAGQFSPVELSTYVYLNVYSDFRYKLIWTNAASIAGGFHHSGFTVRGVQDAMQNLRKNGYIDYPVGGFGKSQTFPVLILKGEPTDGVLKGSRLNGFVSGDYTLAEYVFPDASRAQGVLKLWGERTHDVGCTCVGCAQAVAVSVTLKEVKVGRMPKIEKLEYLEEVEEREEGTVAPVPSGEVSMSTFEAEPADDAPKTQAHAHGVR